jgi:hypothetical protein
MWFDNRGGGPEGKSRRSTFHVPFVASDESSATFSLPLYYIQISAFFANNSSFSSVVERKVSPEYCPTSDEVKANTAIDCSNATNLQVNRHVIQFSPYSTTF